MTMYKNRTGLMVGVPLSGNPLVPEWAFSFHSLHPPMDYNVEYAMVKGKPVDEARNQIAQAAIDKNIKYLFFVDEDVTPPAHSIRQLIYHLEHFPKAAIAGGIYCHKSPPPMPMVFRGNGAGPYWDWKVGEVFDCSGIGMGCAMIRVDVLKTIEKPWFKTIDSVEAYMNGIPQGELWTEDLYFCDKITKAGWNIIADGGLLPDHWDAKTGIPYNLPSHAKPLRRTEVEKGKKKIVDLGSGEEKDSYHTEEGTVLRVDIREDVAPDYRCDLRILPFGNKEFDIVFSSHTLEHFARNEVGKVLDEWIRIMKDDGEFRLVLPNLKWAAQHIMNEEIDNDVMNVLYGAQSYDENFHKVGFTPQIIEQLLSERGFKKYVWDFHNYHMFVRAWKIVPQELLDAGLLEAGHVAPIARVKDGLVWGEDKQKELGNLPELPSHPTPAEVTASALDLLHVVQQVKPQEEVIAQAVAEGQES
jgi:predicted SAM-dependent methyltransferase